MIDDLPEAELEALEEWLRVALRQRDRTLQMRETSFTDEEVEDADLRDRKPISNEEFRRILDEAPLDDEPLTDADREALRLSRASKPSDRISHSDLMKLLGL